MSVDTNDSIRSVESKSPESDFAKRWRKVRACARCHRLKMKCSYNDPKYGSCKRCFDAQVECSPDVDPTYKKSVTRQRKKPKIVNIPDFKKLNEYIMKIRTSTADDPDPEKVKANLTEEISGLRNTKLQLGNFISQIDSLIDKKQFAMADPGDVTEPVLPPSIITHQNLPIIPFERNLVQQLVKLNYLTVKLIEEKFQTFKNELLVYWPVIHFPDFYTCEYLIKNKPLLLVSFLVTSCLTQNELTLYTILSYYLDINLSHNVFVKGNLSMDIIQSYLVLSMWNSPPKQWGTFKHQLHLLTSLNLNLVVDLGLKAEQLVYENAPLDFANEDIIRTYLMIYSSCGSLGLSLPKFKLVNWSSNHQLVCNYLTEKFSDSSRRETSSRTDIFIYYMSQLIFTGQELTSQLESSIETSLVHENINKFLTKYEDRLVKLMLSYKSADVNSVSKENPLVGLTYQQIMMMMYDHLIYRTLSSSLILFVTKSFNKDIVDTPEYRNYKLSVSVLEKLILVCKKLIDNFLTIIDQTLRIPTFFHYRPMNALISLIKAKILIKLLLYELDNQVVSKEILDDITGLDFNLRSFFNHFYASYEAHAKKSMVFEKMFVIVKKIKKLIKLVDNLLNKRNPRKKTAVLWNNSTNGTETIAGFNFKIQDNRDKFEHDNLTITSELANNDLLNLLCELGTEKAVENIGFFELNPENRRKRKNKQRQEQLQQEQLQEQQELLLQQNVSDQADYQDMNFLVQELFSDNLFDEIINDSEFLDFISQPDNSRGPFMETVNSGSNISQVHPAYPSIPDEIIRQSTEGNIGYNINNFLSQPIEELINVDGMDEANVENSAHHKAGSLGSYIDDYDNQFWTNKTNS